MNFYNELFFRDQKNLKNEILNQKNKYLSETKNNNNNNNNNNNRGDLSKNC